MEPAGGTIPLSSIPLNVRDNKMQKRRTNGPQTVVLGIAVVWYGGCGDEAELKRNENFNLNFYLIVYNQMKKKTKIHINNNIFSYILILNFLFLIL